MVTVSVLLPFGQSPTLDHLIMFCQRLCWDRSGDKVCGIFGFNHNTAELDELQLSWSG